MTSRIETAHNWLADWVLTPMAKLCLWLIKQRRRRPVTYWSCLLAALSLDLLLWRWLG